MGSYSVSGQYFLLRYLSIMCLVLYSSEADGASFLYTLTSCFTCLSSCASTNICSWRHCRGTAVEPIPAETCPTSWTSPWCCLAPVLCVLLSNSYKWILHNRVTPLHQQPFLHVGILDPQSAHSAFSGSFINRCNSLSCSSIIYIDYIEIWGLVGLLRIDGWACRS